MGEHLTRRDFHGPTWCFLCKCESESTDHHFLQCNILLSLWNALSTLSDSRGNGMEMIWVEDGTIGPIGTRDQIF